MKRLIVMGSPRADGRSAHLAEMLFEACIDECPEDELYLAPVSELDIAPCIACDACRAAGEMAAHARLGDEETAAAADAAGGADGDGAGAGDADDAGDELPPIPYCPRFDDDMLDLYEVFADADELTVVAPVFFSGAPASLTALLDRMQPFFWEWLALRQAGDDGAALARAKRPATLHVIGEGLDRNGYVALVSKVRSAIAPAGFRLDRVLDWVGKIDEDGTIQGEADEYALPPLGKPLAKAESYLLPLDDAPALTAPAQTQNAAGDRPKLNLSGNGSSKQRKKNGKRHG